MLDKPLVNAELSGGSAVGHVRSDRIGSIDRTSSRIGGLMPEGNGYKTDFPRLFFIPAWWKVLTFAMFLALVVLCCTVWRDMLEDETGLTPGEFVKYLSIPFVSVVFTYSHIWAALWMTFYPLDFWGIKSTQIPGQPWGLGWQGIAPSKVKKMATGMIRNIIPKVITLEEIFERINPEVLQKEIEAPLSAAVVATIEDVGREAFPEIWNSLPKFSRQEIVIRVHEEVPRFMADLKERVQADISSVFDIEEMVVTAMCREKQLLNHMFITCGFKDLEFLIDLGAKMGLLFGVIQMFQQYIWPVGWTLPVYGAVVGLLTNWVAIKLVFWPVHPKRFCGGCIVLHGQFLQRQYEVSAEYAAIFADNIASSRNLIPAVIRGRCSDRLFEVIRDEVGKTVDNCTGVVKPVVRRMDPQTLEDAKRLAAERVMDAMPATLLSAERYLDQAMDIETLLTERGRAMPFKDFEQLLHPVLAEDEWVLILLGGILGVLVGNIQWAVLGR